MGNTATKLHAVWKDVGHEMPSYFFPNGMIGNVYITSMLQNDKGVIDIYGLEEELHMFLIE